MSGTRNPMLQEEMYAYIVDFKLKHNGLSPNYNEIASHCGCSKSTVSYNMIFLRKSGRVQLLGQGSYRNIMVPALTVTKGGER